MTEYDTLEKVIVGVETFEKTRRVDYTLKLFFKNNMHDYYHDDGFIQYDIADSIIQERKEDLKTLAQVLQSHGITVCRPKPCGGLKTTRTPFFDSIAYSNSNVRDLCLSLDGMIICSYSSVRSRFFENILLYDILMEEMQAGTRVISPPVPSLDTLKIDSVPWEDYSIDEHVRYYPDYEILFDAANCMKVTNNDIIMNIGNRNAYNGYTWLRSVLPDNINLHPINICDNHIDGTILPLREGLFLANTCFLDKAIRDYLPKKFKSWDIIEINETKLDKAVYDQSHLTGPELATWEGMDVNVLSLSPDTVLIQDTFLRGADILDKHGFNVVTIPFRHSTIFGGGIHCSTLDLRRSL